MGLSWIVLVLAAPLLDPALPELAKFESKAVKFGHVRMCQTLEKDADKAQAALDTILDACPDFFASRDLPRLFARAVRPNDPQGPLARERLVAAKQDAPLANPAFRDAVRYYVLEAQLLQRGEAYQDKAAPVLAKLRERENAALCWHTTTCLSVAATARATTPVGPVPAELITASKCDPKYCGATGKATFAWDGKRVTCATHGPAEPQGKLASEDALKKAALKNPMLWGVDHLRRLLAAESALGKLPKTR